MNYSNLDIYAKRASFFYNNQERIGSYFGLFLTALYIIASIVLFIYYLILTIERKEIRVYDSSLYAQEMPYININKNSFYFAFGLEDPVTLNRFVNETIYKAEVVFIDRVKKNGEFETIVKDELPLEKCNVENFGKNYQHLFLEGELKNSYCLKDFDYNLTFAGGFKYERMSYLRIKIYPCKNSSENNNHCQPQEIIDHFLTSGYFSILLKDIGLNPSNYSDPIIPTLQDLYTTIDRRLYKNYILNFGLAEIQTDTGLIEQNIQKNKYIQFRKDVQTFSFRDESDYLAGNEICLIQIRLDDNILVQKRTYTKISEILSLIGGYMQLMNTVFLLISMLVNKIDSELKIINSIFNFNLKKNKIILKYQSLQSLNTMNIPKSAKNIIYSTKKTVKDMKTIESENNKSNYNLILKNNNNSKSNIISSPLKSFDNNQKLLKNKTYKINMNKRNYINPFNDNNKRKSINSNINSNINLNRNVGVGDNDSLNNDLQIIISTNNKVKNSSFSEYTKEISITLFDYFCPGRNINKKRMLGLYHLGIAFYRRRMDIVIVFSHLLLTEKFMLKNRCTFIYPSCREIELLYPKT